MAEVFFGAAWVAGIVEGGSVLVHANKQEERSRIPLIIPSLLYATTALPLGMIGASPGPRLVSMFPFAPSVESLRSNGATLPPRRQQRPSTAGNKDDDTTEPKQDLNNDAETTTTTTTNDDGDDHHTIISRSAMIRKVRDDNRRMLAASKHYSPRQTTPSRKRVHSRRTAKWIATLDGQPLTTSLAEAMRRARFLCVGAGLCMFAMTYTYREQNAEFVLEREQRLRGKSVHAVASFIKNADNGVALRLVNGQNESLVHGLTKTSTRNVVLPLVHSPVDASRDVCLPFRGGDNSDDDFVYWNLGNTPEEWKEMPLTKDWLVCTNDDSDEVEERLLLLEADVSPRSLSEYVADQPRIPQPDTLASLENLLQTSRILTSIAKQKGVMSSDDNASVNVVIGSGPRPTWLKDASIVYINGTAAVEKEIVSTLERIYPALSECSETPKEAEPQHGNDSTQSITSNQENLESETLFSLFEYIGMKLRQGSARVASTITRVFAGKRTKTVHVLSDGPLPAVWLQRIIPYGWTILGYHALGDVDIYQHVITETGGIVFVCCDNDEATCATVCSLLTDKVSSSASRIVALVRIKECESMLKDMAADLNEETVVEVVSIVDMHNRLFGQARGLLASGMGPSEAQDSI